MVNKWYLQLGNANEYQFIAQPELLFCSYGQFKVAASNDLIVRYEANLIVQSEQSQSVKCEQEDGHLSNKTTYWLRSDQRLTERYYFEPDMLNIASESYSTASTADKNSIWRIRGLQVKEQLADERLFLVRIFDLCLLSWQRVNASLKPMHEAKAVQRDTASQIRHDGSIISEKTLRKLEVHASRALYALWLDVGSVLVAISGTGTIAIREVWSLDDLHYADDLQAISESMHYLTSETLHHGEHKLLIGADPEFALLNEHNQIVPASSFVDINSDAKIGADALMLRRTIVYPLVELRPSPQPSPNQLYMQIKQLLLEASHYIKDGELRWVAGAMPVAGLALGGHIHFSGVNVTPRLLHLLDGLVAIPLATIEDPLGRGRYKRYGSLGDYRRQSHGGFEYRTPPSWLVSPKVTKAALTLAFIAMQDYELLSRSFCLTQQWCDAYDQGDYELLALASRAMLDQIATLPSSSERANEIEPLRRAIEDQRHWDEQLDIRERWGFKR